MKAVVLTETETEIKNLVCCDDAVENKIKIFVF